MKSGLRSALFTKGVFCRVPTEPCKGYFPLQTFHRTLLLWVLWRFWYPRENSCKFSVQHFDTLHNTSVSSATHPIHYVNFCELCKSSDTLQTTCVTAHHNTAHFCGCCGGFDTPPKTSVVSARFPVPKENLCDFFNTPTPYRNPM